MAVQILPIVKAVAPYVADIAKIAIPIFTSKKPPSAPEETKPDPVIITQQIEELQQAASQNAQSVKAIAENLQKALEKIEDAAQEADRKISAYKAMVVFSFGFSILSLALCIYIILR